MKFTWEEKDLQCGRRLRHNGVEFVIGYLVEGEGRDRRLIDLRDGAILKAHAPVEMAVLLNEKGYEPVDG